MTGLTFGRLLVLGPAARRDFWITRCSCGADTDRERYGPNMRYGGAVSCGCARMLPFPDREALRAQAKATAPLARRERELPQPRQSNPPKRSKWDVGVTVGEQVIVATVDKRHRRVRCACGEERVVHVSNLYKIRSCYECGEKRKRERRKKDLVGSRFGRLTVMGPGERGHRTSRWLCQCDCGRQTGVALDSLRSGGTRSCGCLNKDAAYRRTKPEHRGLTVAERNALRQQSEVGLERRRQYARAYNLTPQAHAAWTQRNAALRNAKIAAGREAVTGRVWLALCEAYNLRCAYCDRIDVPRLTLDHVIPVRRDGTHATWNVLPACDVCNRKKSAKPLGVALRDLGVDADKFWKRREAAYRYLQDVVGVP